ncbi:hypothetical protein BCV72DRAFT_187673, partial [Rhizopus microsporus var. microsporus]
IDCLRNCALIDEYDFHINMDCKGAWASRSETPIVKVENTRTVSHAILDAISIYAVVNVSVRVPSVYNTQIAPVDPKPKGTTANHYLRFLKETLDVMNNFEYMRNSYLVMDNAAIHQRADIQEMIEERGYICVYLLPYSLELNPIE